MRTCKIVMLGAALGLFLALAGCGGGGGGGGAAQGPLGTQMGGAIQGGALSLTNTVTAMAGTGSSADGIGILARFNTPNSIATDGTNLFVIDGGNSTIRKIVIATGATTTLAGSAGATGSADGIGAAARFNNPSGIAISPDNAYLYVADSGNNTIRRVTVANGTVTTVAGTAGVTGSADGVGAAASFSAPAGIATDGTNLYVADTYNNIVREIVIATMTVSTFAGSGAQGAGDGAGAAASFDNPSGITTDGTSLFVADSGSGAIRSIVIATAEVSTLVAPGGGFTSPAGIATDGTNLFVSDSAANVIRKVVIDTLAVSPLAGDASGGTPGAAEGAGGAARFNAPAGVVLNGGTLYIADSENNAIRAMAISTATVSTLAGTASANGTGASAGFKNPYDVTTDGTNLYVADSWNGTIRKIVIATRAVSTLAGTEDVVGAADGTGAAATFSFPSAITTDGTNLYVADTDNNKIRKIVIATGAVSTFAGTGTAGQDNGAGATATFDAPGGITTDGTNLYVADTNNNAIRKIVIATGVVSTLATGFNTPYGLTTDGTNLYVADAGSNTIRKVIIATGAASMVTLSGATLDFPTGVTTDGTNLYVSDSGNATVRRVVIATGAATTVSSAFKYPSGITTDGASLFVADADASIIARVN